ncbi:MAG: hypothetical protein H7336_04280 [Bacteriovorax sp.]|nr:hypothetical protein [Bacteriovorax sp.]
MKMYLSLFVLLFSASAFSQTHFNAVLIKDLNILSISVEDDGIIPPYEAGLLWRSMIGTDERKYIEENGFSLECDAIRNGTNDVYGSCTFNIPMKSFQKIGDVQVYKLKGTDAAKLNRYFIDSAYVSLQNGKVYLSSHNTTREFFFGIPDNMIQH